MKFECEIPVKRNASDICFIVCPDYWGFIPSLGVASLTGVLKHAGYKVKVADINIEFQRRCNIYENRLLKIMDSIRKPLETVQVKKNILRHLVTGQSLESLPDDLQEHKICQELFVRYNFFMEHFQDEVAASSKILGFSIITENLLCSLAVINLVKSDYPDRTIIVGGPECHSLNSMEVLKLSPNIDIIYGTDGEIALLNYLDSINDKTAEKSGYMIQVDGSWKDYGERKLSNDEFNRFGIMADFSEFPLHLYFLPGVLPLATSRGCVGKCIFCSERHVYSPYRRLGTNSLKEMLIRIRDEYSPSEICFADSLLNGSSKIFSGFLKALKEINWKIPWEGNVRADNIDGKCFKLLWKTGCKRISCGIESMIPEVLHNMRKEVLLTNIEQTIRIAHDNGIKVHGYIIVGFPGEKTEDYIKTLPFLLEMDSLYPHVIEWKYLPTEDVDAIYCKFGLKPSLDLEKFLDRENDPPPIVDHMKKRLRSLFFTDENGYTHYDRTLRQIYTMQLLEITQHVKSNKSAISLGFIKKYDWLPFPVVKAESPENQFIFFGKKIASKTKLGNDILASMDGKNTVKQIVKELTTEKTSENEVYTAINDILATVSAQ